MAIAGNFKCINIYNDYNLALFHRCYFVLSWRIKPHTKRNLIECHSTFELIELLKIRIEFRTLMFVFSYPFHV